MNGRYSPTERIGVNAVERIVIQELGWVFREQSIVDIGVDAIIEQCENGNPTGRFIAVQIKSGEYNFSISRNLLTYYVSHIHYNYWLNLNIPIILAAHLPESGKTYWQHVCKNNFKKTDKKWKFEIPKIQELNLNSKLKLSNILSAKWKNSISADLYHGKMNIATIYDANENSSSEEIIVCINNINQFINKIEHYINIFIDKLQENNEMEIDNEFRMYRQKAIMSWFAKILDIYSDRLEGEVFIYSREIAKVFYAFEHVILFNFLKLKDITELRSVAKSLEELFESMDTEKNKMHHLLRLEKLDSPIDHIAIKEANAILNESLLKFNKIKKFYFFEFAEGRSILRKIIDRIREKIELINSGHDINLQFTPVP